MARFKALKTFTDKETQIVHTKNSELDITIKRSKEINETLKKHGQIVERIDTETPDKEV